MLDCYRDRFYHDQFLSNIDADFMKYFYLHVEVVMPGKVGVQNEFFNLVVFCIKQNVLETNDVSVVRRQKRES